MGSLPSHQLLRFLASITSTRDSNPDLPARRSVALPRGHRVGEKEVIIFPITASPSRYATYTEAVSIALGVERCKTRNIGLIIIQIIAINHRLPTMCVWEDLVEHVKNMQGAVYNDRIQKPTFWESQFYY